MTQPETEATLVMASEQSPVPTSATESEAATALLIESVDMSKARIDAEQRVIHNVRLIKAGKSLNGRRYDALVLERAAPLFENVKSYSNHPLRSEAKERPERSVREITGWFTDVQFRKDGLYATRHFTRTQAGNDSWSLAEDILAGRAPANLLELSINAIGKGRVETLDGESVLNVEGISRVFSVDDVTTGAAGGTFVPLTASDGDDLVTALVKELTFEEWQVAQPQYVERLKKQWQKVRLEDATKTALAEADQQVKAASAATETLTETVNGLQEDVRRLTHERDTAFALAKDKARELAIERALGRTKLPALYKDDLRKRLPAEPETAWADLIEAERSKAQRAGALPRPGVTGSSAQEMRAVERIVSPRESIEPLPDETAGQWVARIERMQQER